jgi:hypothetical protein
MVQKIRREGTVSRRRVAEGVGVVHQHQKLSVQHEVAEVGQVGVQEPLISLVAPFPPAPP